MDSSRDAFTLRSPEEEKNCPVVPLLVEILHYFNQRWPSTVEQIWTFKSKELTQPSMQPKIELKLIYVSHILVLKTQLSPFEFVSHTTKQLD